MTGDRATRAAMEEASHWVVRFHESEPSPADRRRFVRWLKRSPVHVSEFLQAEADWMALEGIDDAKSIDVGRLLRAPEGNVVSFTQTVRTTTAGSMRQPWRLAAVSLVGLAVLGIVLLADIRSADIYETTLGEQRTVVLGDGSIVELNTRSRIAVHETGHFRDIDLLSGEALFTVARDDQRPFRVFSDFTKVRATGTQFNVYRKPGQTIVTVLEGKVAVSKVDGGAPKRGDDEEPGGVVELGAGDRAVARASTVTRSVVADPRHAIAWRDRRLVFDDEPLATVAQEFNRYNNVQLVIRDEALARRRVSGVFDADRPQAMVRFLLRDGDVEVIDRSDEWVLRSKPQ